MEDERVSFDLAQKAKEKGFDEECDWYYTKLGELEQYPYWDTENKNSELGPTFQNKELDPICVVPTQSLLQRWLREKYNIFVSVGFDKRSDDKEGYAYYSDWCSLVNKEIGWFEDNTQHETYEEALEIGLLEGLKLIENDRE